MSVSHGARRCARSRSAWRAPPPSCAAAIGCLRSRTRSTRPRGPARRVVGRRGPAQPVSVPGLRRPAAEDRSVADAAGLVHRRRRGAVPAVRHHGVLAGRRRRRLRQRHAVPRAVERLSRRLQRLVHAHRRHHRLRARQGAEEGRRDAHVPGLHPLPLAGRCARRSSGSGSGSRSSPTTSTTGSAAGFSSSATAASRCSGSRSWSACSRSAWPSTCRTAAIRRRSTRWTRRRSR